MNVGRMSRRLALFSLPLSLSSPGLLSACSAFPSLGCSSTRCVFKNNDAQCELTSVISHRISQAHSPPSISYSSRLVCSVQLTLCTVAVSSAPCPRSPRHGHESHYSRPSSCFTPHTAHISHPTSTHTRIPHICFILSPHIVHRQHRLLSPWFPCLWHRNRCPALPSWLCILVFTGPSLVHVLTTSPQLPLHKLHPAHTLSYPHTLSTPDGRLSCPMHACNRRCCN